MSLKRAAALLTADVPLSDFLRKDLLYILTRINYMCMYVAKLSSKHGLP